MYLLHLSFYSHLLLFLSKTCQHHIFLTSSTIAYFAFQGFFLFIFWHVQYEKEKYERKSSAVVINQVDF